MGASRAWDGAGRQDERESMFTVSNAFVRRRLRLLYWLVWLFDLILREVCAFSPRMRTSKIANEVCTG